MPEPVLCKICGKRRARRACPAVQGDICTICCGTEREVTLSCPLECEYLREAHRREKPVEVSGGLPNAEIEVKEDFLRSHELLMMFCVEALAEAALNTSGAVDTDLTAALEALIQTHKTFESGLYYETRSPNHLAAAIQRSFQDSLAAFQKERAERSGSGRFRNAEILAILVFLHRFALLNQNGKPRGRMYIGLLREMAPNARVEPDAPRIIL